MDIHIEKTGNATVVRLSGLLAGDARAMLDEQVLPLFETERNLLVDLSAADFLSAEGLRLLLKLYRQGQTMNVRLILCGLSRELQDILSMTGLMAGSLPMFETLEAGLSELTSSTRSAEEPEDTAFEESAYDPGIAFSIPVEEEEEVNFSAFYPKELAVEKWYSLLVYAFVPSALEAVRRDAERFKSEIGDMRETKKPVATQLTRGTEITLVPSCEGVTFNPERYSFKWFEDQHRAQFRLRADSSMADMAGNGQVTIYVGPVIVGTLKMAMLFSETEADISSAGSEEATGRMYRQDEIFISYSHRDTAVIHNCQKAYNALGFNVLIDSETLRSGQKWNDELMRMIERADIFQLFWSENSSNSKYCKQEWEHALRLNKGEGFIRPVYWKEPIPEPPAELGDLHFDFVPFAGQD